MRIVFATNNLNKVKEVQNQLINTSGIELVTLKEIGFDKEIPEDFDTLEENALQKAKTIADICGLDVLADDTGLFVDALEGRPGVFSARYAGEDATDKENVQKLLAEMNGKEGRAAHFKTVFCLVSAKEGVHYFTGVCHGEILQKQTGEDGFGYDPVFKPIGFEKSFAQMNKSEKNEISHRGKAMVKVVEYLSR